MKPRVGWLTLLIALAAAQAAAQTRPNVVLIYADDLGYGDVSAYGATAPEDAEHRSRSPAKASGSPTRMRRPRRARRRATRC